MNDDLQPDHRPAFPYSRFLVGLALLCGTTSLLLWPIGWLNTIPKLSGSRHLTTLTFATLGISVAMFLALKVLEHSGDFDIHRRAGRASWMLLAIATTAYFPPRSVFRRFFCASRRLRPLRRYGCWSRLVTRTSVIRFVPIIGLPCLRGFLSWDSASWG